MVYIYCIEPQSAQSCSIQWRSLES